MLAALGIQCLFEGNVSKQRLQIAETGNMTADSFDNFNYERASKHTSEAQRKHYWAVAIGLQDVDGLKVSDYLRETAASYIAGKKTLEETGQLIRSYHANESNKDTSEADLVSQRIAELLTSAPFYLSPQLLSKIHEYLFQDLDRSIYHPGEYKTERMVKQEEILNGDSVLYADPLTYEMSLQGAFNVEAARAYTTFTREEIHDFCHTISFLWQVYPFYEGNTRTIAVFSELYLNYLGFDVVNEPFEKHAKYFRNALVRALYRNATAKIFPDNSFIIKFYENVLGLEHSPLCNEEMICTALFDNPALLRNVDPAEALFKGEWPANEQAIKATGARSCNALV